MRNFKWQMANAFLHTRRKWQMVFSYHTRHLNVHLAALPLIYYHLHNDTGLQMTNEKFQMANGKWFLLSYSPPKRSPRSAASHLLSFAQRHWPANDK